MPNKKILGTIATTKYGIEFKSTSECRMFELLMEAGFNPEYEPATYKLTNSFRPTVPFFKRKGKGIKSAFVYDMSKVPSISYTPDFSFMYNNIFVIIECKGYENDVYPYKRILFRALLESYNTPVMFFQVQTMRELKDSIIKIKMESDLLSKIRKKIIALPAKDIPIANRYLDSRDWESLDSLVSSAIKRVNNSRSNRARESSKLLYKDIDITELEDLNMMLFQYMSKL